MAWSARSEVLLLLLCALLCALLSAIGYAGVIAAPLVADDYSIWLGLTDGSSGLAAGSKGGSINVLAMKPGRR